MLLTRRFNWMCVYLGIWEALAIFALCCRLFVSLLRFAYQIFTLIFYFSVVWFLFGSKNVSLLYFRFLEMWMWVYRVDYNLELFWLSRYSQVRKICCLVWKCSAWCFVVLGNQRSMVIVFIDCRGYNIATFVHSVNMSLETRSLACSCLPGSNAGRAQVCVQKIRWEIVLRVCECFLWPLL